MVVHENITLIVSPENALDCQGLHLAIYGGAGFNQTHDLTYTKQVLWSQENTEDISSPVLLFGKQKYVQSKYVQEIIHRYTTYLKMW